MGADFQQIELNQTDNTYVLVSFNNVTSTQIFLVKRNNKYYTIALISDRPGTISEYYV